MLENLKWKPFPEDEARAVVAQLMDAESPDVLSDYQIRGSIAALPPYPTQHLLQLVAKYRAAEAWHATLYALYSEDAPPLLLNGESAAVYIANERDHLQLTEETVAEYVRFFCFAVRGADGPFILIEPPEPDHTKSTSLDQFAKPISVTGRDESQRILCETVMAYNGAVFSATMAVAAGGQIEMVDDKPLTADFQQDELPVLPDLGSGSALRLHVSAMTAGIAAAPSAAEAGLPPLQALTELLLESALQKQAGHRLIESFRASLSAIPPIDEFAALVFEAAPVVIVESNLPFVEETIARIVSERYKTDEPLPVVTAQVGSDDTEVTIQVPTSGRALLLIPLQVYRRVTNVDRLAYYLASKAFSGIVACEQVSQLPESLRRVADIVLHLPNIDPPLFERLFQRVIGHPVPADWSQAGTDWVKHIQYMDFAHPRRIKLPSEEAFRYIRSLVQERLGVVNASEELGLNQLYGLGEARQFASDLIADIHAAMKGEIPWSQVDRGALLVGAPGTGKTTLAKAIAKDCGVRFINASATEWQATGQHLGHHIAAIRKTFAEARRYAPTILFIDEIDSIGNRETFTGYAAQYSTEVVNALLEQMQGVDPGAPVFVMAATNHEDRVDPALRRSGRLDRVIRIPRPNTESLALIYKHYLNVASQKQGLDQSIDPTVLGRLSLGLTGADLERIVRGAARRARREARLLMQNDLIAEITDKPRSSAGTLRLTPKQIERTALHEAGHALAMFLSPSSGIDIGFLTVVPREDGTLGFVAPMVDAPVSMTRRDYKEKIQVYLAGRAAEEIRYGADEVTDGATNDLQAASALAVKMVSRLGLGQHRKLLASEYTSTEDISAANDLLVEAYDRILERLRAHSSQLDALAKALAARQELSGDEAREILASSQTRTASG